MDDEKVRRLGARLLTKVTGRTADVGAALNAIQRLTPLPASYRELLMRFRGPIVFDNGARFTSDKPSPLNDKNGFQSLELLYGVGGGQYSVEQKIRQYEGELPAGFIPVGEAPGGNLLCVDESGAVYLWDHESMRGAGGWRVAASLVQFLDRLEPDEDDVANTRGIIESQSYLDS